jgi:GDP-6-deoxy-D-talose 4-dehydrogenase
LKILLTGADGFTGCHFRAMAESAGHEVVVVRANLLAADALVEEVAAAQADAVLHLAAISMVTHADNRAFYDVNLFGTLNLLDALKVAGTPPRCVLLASSANIYGNCDSSPISETQPPAPVNHYAVSKLAMEYLSRNYADQLPLVLARPFNYTGPAQPPSFLIPKLVAHFARGDSSVELGNLDVQREFNDVRMVCNAYLQLLQHGEAGETYNVCSGKPYTLKFVLDELTRLTGQSIEVQVNPHLIRKNDLHRLYGSPAKLDTLLAAHGIMIDRPPLADTLQSMLDARVLHDISRT